MNVVHDAKGNYTDELGYFQRPLIIKQNYHGRNHLDITVLYNNIGLAHQCLDQFDRA